MATTIAVIRDFNVASKELQTKFNITDVKPQPRDKDDIFHINPTLYTFSMNWKKYVEYIKKRYCENGNTFNEYIDYLEKGEKIPETIQEYYWTFFECPECQWLWCIIENNILRCTTEGCKYTNLESTC